MEKCATCQKIFYRSQPVRSASRGAGRKSENKFLDRHATGRLCTCGGPLTDNIVHFGEGKLTIQLCPLMKAMMLTFSVCRPSS